MPQPRVEWIVYWSNHEGRRVFASTQRASAQALYDAKRVDDATAEMYRHVVIDAMQKVS